MKKHTRIYLREMRYDESDFIPCELCGSRSVDIHHIHARGMGGSNAKDRIENLMALCRTCHHEKGDRKEFKVMLVEIHNQRMDERGVVRHFG